MKITGFKINASNMPATATNRAFTVTGDNGAIFSLSIKKSNGNFYDFKTETFTSTFTSQNTLTNIELQGSYTSSINFPANASGDTYTYYLWASPHFETEIIKSLSINPVLHTRTIKQIASSTITFRPSTDTSNKFLAFSTTAADITSTGSPTQIGTTVVNVDWAFKNHGSDAGSFGLLLNNQTKPASWFYGFTQTVNGAITSAYNLVLDDLTNVAIGSRVTAVSSGSLSGTPIVIEIYRDRKEIKLSEAQTFADGITLTFEAPGINNISKTSGAKMTFENMVASITQLTKTVRGAISNSTTINLDGTYGVSKGGTVRGIGFTNTEANPIVSVSASSSAGSMVVTSNQTLKAGTKLYIDGCGEEITLKGKIYITKYPTADTIIYLDVDSFISPGTAS